MWSLCFILSTKLSFPVLSVDDAAAPGGAAPPVFA